MSTLQHKIDFAVILRVKRANPNGDPLNGNRPRTDYNGLAEISDVCLKRKMRDRLMESGENIFVQSDDRKNDDAKSLRDRAEKSLGKEAFVFRENKKKKSKETSEDAAGEAPVDLAQMKTTIDAACARWFDVRAFGQLLAWGDKKKKKANEGMEGEAEVKEEKPKPGVSIPVRGPVTMQSAFSLRPVDVTSTQITKSVSSDAEAHERGSDTMGMKHRVDDAVYVFYGSMNPQLAERTGFGDADAEAIKAVLPKLFENDVSSARPDGSMAVLKVLWWLHKAGKCGQYSSARVHGTLRVDPDGTYTLDNLDGLVPEEIDGF